MANFDGSFTLYDYSNHIYGIHISSSNQETQHK